MGSLKRNMCAALAVVCFNCFTNLLAMFLGERFALASLDAYGPLWGLGRSRARGLVSGDCSPVHLYLVNYFIP